MEDELTRFDMENVEFDSDGSPKIPRIGFTVPKAYRREFLQDMIDEVRSTPGEQLMAVFVKYYRMKRTERIAAETKGSPQAAQNRLPVYGPKPSSGIDAQSKLQSEGAE
jgi:hypothetical protein